MTTGFNTTSTHRTTSIAAVGFPARTASSALMLLIVAGGLVGVTLIIIGAIALGMALGHPLY